MSSIAKSALYQGGNRGTAPLPLSLYSQQRLPVTSRHIRISCQAVNQLGGIGKIRDLSEDGPIINGHAVGLSSIFIRLVNQPFAERVFIANAEIATLGKRFGLPTAVLDSAVFEKPENNKIHPDFPSISPRWPELLEPAWKLALLKWRVGRGRLPQPPQLPWVTLRSGHLPIPGLAEALPYDVSRGAEIYGQFTLIARAGFRGGTFTAATEIEFTSSGARKTQTAVRGEEFLDPALFHNMFGKGTRNKILLCSKRAGRTDLSFPSVRGEQFSFASTRAVSLNPGTVYYFRFTRNPNILNIECFTDEAKTNLHGRLILNLEAGYPSRSTRKMSLQPAEEQ